MNVKNNSRYKASCQKIETAFLALCLNNDYDDIKVNQICEQAGINRSTFYAHYNDVDDLTAKIEARFAKSMASIFTFNEKPSTKTFVEMFTFIKNNKYFYKAFLNLPQRSIAEEDARDKVLSTIDHKELLQTKSETELLYRSSFFGAGIKEICRIWLDRDCKESPTEMAELILKEYTNRN